MLFKLGHDFGWINVRSNQRAKLMKDAGSLPASLVGALESRFTVHHIHQETDPLAKLQEIGPQIRGAVGHGMAGLTKPYIELMPNLEVFTIHGVGLETTDMAARRERGIVVTTTPVLFDDVADLALALALATCRQLPRADRFVREGDWKKGRMAPGRKLTGMRAGIVGLGRIGLEVARMLEGFKTQISLLTPRVATSATAESPTPLPWQGRRTFYSSVRPVLPKQLSEQDLSEQLGVSRTPVREAFQRLEMERLVEIRPQRGTYVFRYDITELREISELREILETGALRMAIAHHPDLLSRVLSEKLEEAEAALAQGPAGFQSYDSAFHQSLVRASRNREIIEAYLRVSGRIRAIRFRLTRTDKLTRSAQKDHRAITRLVVARKYEEAELRVGKHVYNGYRTFAATLKAEDSVGPSPAISNFRR